MTSHGNDDSFLTSPTLVSRLRAQDREAWERFAELYAPLVYRWTRACGLQDADAADVTQEVLLTVQARLDLFERKHTGHSLRAWMRTISKNKCFDLLRARQRQATAAGGTDAQLRMGELAEPEIELRLSKQAFDEEATLMWKAVDMLRTEFEQHTWQAFMQTAVQNRKAADVAADLGMSVGSVYTAKSRVLARLRSEFEGLL